MNFFFHHKLGEGLNKVYAKFKDISIKIKEITKGGGGGGGLTGPPPTIYVTKSPTFVGLKPWISKGILKSIKVKNKLYSKYMKCLDPFWYNKYKIYRDKINHLIRNSKFCYYKNDFSCFYNNSKKNMEWYKKFF